jgi:hypothetical protein
MSRAPRELVRAPGGMKMAIVAAVLATGIGVLLQEHVKAARRAEFQRLANAYARRCEGRPRPTVRVIGERHSGTTWLGKLLERRFCARVATRDPASFWKHGFFGNNAWELPLSTRSGGWSDPAEVVILIVRHPHPWLYAMARRPFDGHPAHEDDWAYTKHWLRSWLPGGRAATSSALETFLRAPWEGRLPPHVAQGRPEWLPDAVVMASHGEARARRVLAANPVALRTAKLRNHLGLKEALQPGSFAAVCHEDLVLEMPRASSTLNRLGAILGVEPLPPLAEGDGLSAWFHASSTRSWWSPLHALFSVTEALYVPEAPAAATAVFTPEQLAFVREHLDSVLEARLNCSSWSAEAVDGYVDARGVGVG